MELAVMADADTWECFPSLLTIAEATGYHRDTVIKSINTLNNRGFIAKRRRRRRTSVYTILEVELSPTSTIQEVEPRPTSRPSKKSRFSTQEVEVERSRSRGPSGRELEEIELEDMELVDNQTHVCSSSTNPFSREQFDEICTDALGNKWPGLWSTLKSNQFHTKDGWLINDPISLVEYLDYIKEQKSGCV